MTDTEIRQAAHEGYRKIFTEAQRLGETVEVTRELAKRDLFFLLIYILGVTFADNDWVFKMCRIVEKDPDGHLDLWSREHFKTTIAMALIMQDILNDPEVTIGIFSFNRPIAKGFLRPIKWQFEQNEKLKELFPEICWTDPQKEAPKWSLDVDTPVLTINGWKRHGDLEYGDKIFGSDGSIIHVIGNSGPSEVDGCLKVTFDDCELIASPEHLWPVECKKKGSWDSSVIQIKETKDLKPRYKYERMLPTPKIDRLCVIDNHLRVDPYILGLWLGNGTAGTNVISFNNEYLDDGLERIHSSGFETYIHRKKDQDNFSMYGVKGLKELLDAEGVLRDKHVPEKYLMAGIENRRRLLQGLMDSDGTCKKETKHRAGGMCMFSNTNKNIADSVMFLAKTLGMRPSRIAFTPKSRGRKEVHHIYFVGVKDNPPFLLPAKLERCKDSRVKVGRYIKKIENIGKRTVNCIKVSAEDSLYLAGYNMVPTHNSEDDGIIVRRNGTPKEATVEAWGVIDGQPTSKHFRVMIFDDVVTKESVGTPEMSTKVTDSVSMAFNLGSNLGGRRRFYGTRYHYADTYSVLIARQAVIPRVYGATKDNTPGGEPWLWTSKVLEEKIRDMGPYISSCQLFNMPIQEGDEVFLEGWVKYWIPDVGNMGNMNKYILVDPANEKKENSDYTVMMVIGLGSDGNYYLIDMIRDRLNLDERTNRLFKLHSIYKPLAVGYEKYGMQSDIQHFQSEMNRNNYRFTITPLGGQLKKNDRIKRLQPIFQTGRFYLPETLIRVDTKGQQHDLVAEFMRDEYRQFPYMTHDDMLDCMSRICDPDINAFNPDGPIDVEAWAEENKATTEYDYDVYSYIA